MAGSGRWGGMEFVPGALGKLSGGSVGAGSGRREPTPPSRATTSFRGELNSSGIPVAHSRSGSDTLDPRGIPSRPIGSTMGGGRPLSGGSRSGSRGEVNLSTSPNPTQLQPYLQDSYENASNVPQPQGGVSGGGGGGGGGSDYIQRCVIIQRGEKGYGLTVSGDNPVFVQDVKPHGAAARAGVQPGDRIMKVNGTLVTSSNHVEVVRMIKSGSLVSLTLLGRPPGSERLAGHRSRQSEVNSNSLHPQVPESSEPPKVIDGEMAWAKVKSLQKYLDDALADRENLAAEYKKHPNDRSYGKILENNRLIEQLHAQVQDACRKAGIPLPPSSSDENTPPVSGSKFPYPQDGPPTGSIAYPSTHDEQSTPRHDVIGMTGNVGVDVIGGTQSPTASPMAQSLLFGSTHEDDEDDTGLDVALFNDPVPQTPAPSENIYPSSPHSSDFDASPVSPGIALFPVGQPPLGLPPTAPPFSSLSLGPMGPMGSGFGAMDDNNIITMEDDDLQEDIANTESGPFSDFGKLKQNPAHLAVFLRYLIDNSDPSCLFFYLITESYASSSSNIKDLKRWAYEISSTFLFEGSPLALNIDEIEVYVKHVNEILETKIESMADLRNIFDDIRKHAQEKIVDTLSEFRHNRQIGMGGFYGDHLLKESDGKLKEPAKQLRIVESLLSKFLKDWTANYGEWEEMTDRNQALTFCLVTFFKLYGLETVYKQTYLEKIPVFVSKQNNRVGFARLTGGGGGGAKTEKHVGHSLSACHYTMKTDCDQCNSLLWGIGILQGYQCKHCNLNYHKSCINSIENHCTKSTSKGIFGPISKPKLKPKEERDVKEHSPEGEDGVNTLPSDHGSIKSVKGVIRTQSMKNSDGLTGIKVKRNPSDPKSDPEKVKEMLAETGGPITTGPSASQSSLESDGSTTTVQDSDNEPNNSKAAETSTLQTSGISDPIMGDSEFLLGDELPRLEDIIAPDHLLKMNKKEKEKQKVINELFHTELTHVRHLRVLETLFYIPMRNEHIMIKDDLDTLFPNLSEVINIHTDLQQAMKIRRDESAEGPVDHVSDILLERFQGEKGAKFRETSANFLKNQGYALDMLRDKKKKDPKLAKFLQEKEEDQRCRRLQFKDLLPEEMQRIVKYPILLESLAKHLEKESDEHKGILEAIKESKAITTYVNAATRDCQNKHNLHDIQKRLDTSPFDRSGHPLSQEFKNLDVTQRGELIHEGDLEWRLHRNQGNIKLRVLLFKDFILMLTRPKAGTAQSKQDEKYVLRCHGNLPQIHSPIIRVKHVHFREVATEKRAFFLVIIDTDHKNDGENKPAASESGLLQFYARSVDERKRWQEYIEDAVKAAGGVPDAQRFHHSRGGPTVVPTNLTKTSAGVTIMKQPSHDEEEHVSAAETIVSSLPQRDVNGGSLGSLSTSTLTGGEIGPGGDAASPGVHGADDTFDLTTPLTPVETGGLVQPNEVTVHKINASSAIVSRTGETLTSPQDQLKSKDAQIRKLLVEKQRILSGMHRLPATMDWASIAESAATSVSEDGHRQPKNKGEMLLAAWHQVEQLTLLTLDHQTALPTAPPTAAPTAPSQSSGEHPPLPHRRESAEAKSASLGRNAYLQEPTPRNRHTSSPAISDVFSISSKQESKDPHLRQQTQESSTIPSFKLVPIVLSLQENLSSLLSVMEISPSSCPGDRSHSRMVRADSIPPYPPPPPPPGIPPDEMSVTPPTSNTPPIAPPTPFAGGYRGSKHREEGVGQSDEDEGHRAKKQDDVHCYPSGELASSSPIPICPPPPKDTLLPTRTSSNIGDDDEEDEGDVMLADELNNDDTELTPRDHSASSTPLPPARPSGRGGGASPLSTPLSPSSPPHKSLSPGRVGTRSSLSPARSSPRTTSPLPQRHPVSNNHVVMEEGEESFIDDDNSNLVNSIAAPSSATTSPVVSPTPASDVAETDHKLRKTKKNKRKKNSSSNDASVSSGGGASNSSGTLEGGVPFPTPRLEDDDSFELNTTYV